MVDRYYRKIENVENEIENSIQISGILLKLKEHDDDLSKNNEKSINNKNDINNNKNDITNNQKSINNNKNDITNNQKSINNNKNDINHNITDINHNKNDINNNITDINNNKNDITNNQKSINNNKNDIVNIKSFYNLSDIYIYDIKTSSQNVTYTNHFHIFEKEIIKDFKKDGYLEIILKVLTEISHYLLIGFFEILCTFYDDKELFYTISLSTAAGSINKLSTLKSVFLVKIKNDTNKIKIDFYIKPKESQKNRKAIFNIIDINSNKIYIKYYKKN